MSNFVSIQSEENKIRLKNMYLVGIFIGFCWILFHFTLVFFFGFALESTLLVGLFLGIGNFVAMLFDIPVGVLQKYIKPKKFLLLATGMMVLACLIIVKFVYFEGISEMFLPVSDDGFVDKTISFLGNFLSSGLNVVLLIISACLYGLIKESYDVTTLSYIFNNASPSEYASIISRYNIFSGIGSMIGLIFSGILLAINIKIAIVIFLLIIMGFFIFIYIYFDNNDRTINFSDIKNIRLDVLKSDITQKGADFAQNISTQKFIELSKQTKLILLKPVEAKKEFNFDEIRKVSLEEGKKFIEIMMGFPKDTILLGLFIVICLYGFWDTFVSTFQVDFLDKVIDLNRDSFLISQTGGLLTAYVLLGLLVIPAFVFQDFFINLSKKMGVYYIVLLGTIVSAVSLFCFGIFGSLSLVLLFGLINSVGYAAAMPIAQSSYSQRYNEDYAKKYQLKEIDSSVSAAPLKIVLNFANVIGVLFGGILVSIFGFNGFFMFFGGVLFCFFVYAFIKKKTINIRDLDIKDEEVKTPPPQKSFQDDFE